MLGVPTHMWHLNYTRTLVNLKMHYVVFGEEILTRRERYLFFHD